MPHYCGETLCLTFQVDQADQLDRPTDLEGEDADYHKGIEKDENPSALGDAFHDYIFDFIVSMVGGVNRKTLRLLKRAKRRQSAKAVLD